MASGANLRVRGERLWDSLMEMAAVGPGVAGGNDRQALTDADAEGRQLFRRWCEAAGLRVGVDRMGTMYARREGTDPTLDPVCMGSHLDTQPTGGRYDGVLGVLGGLEAIRTLNDAGIRTRRPLLLVNWTNEEGTRFAPAMLASGVYAGVHPIDYAHDRTDARGVRFGDELSRIGFMGEEEVGARRMHSMFELHIEQGPILEAENVEIGVVTHGQGLWWLEMRLTGREAHTGSTPMAMRVDAGLGAARIADHVNRVALRHQPDAVGAVGQLTHWPNSRNVIAGRAVLTVDIRSPDGGKLDAMRAEVEEGARAIANALGLAIAIEPIGHFDPVTFDASLADSVRRAADALGHSRRDIVSGAGHDACWTNRVCPTVMIFTPCEGGLSHNEAEAITPDQARAGTDVLLHAVLEAAEAVP